MNIGKSNLIDTRSDIINPIKKSVIIASLKWTNAPATGLAGSEKKGADYFTMISFTSAASEMS